MFQFLECGLKYNPNLPEDVQVRLKALDGWDFSQLIEDMTPRLILEEGRLFSIEQLIPILLHYGQFYPEVKLIAQKALLPWLGDSPQSQGSLGIDAAFIEQACIRIKSIVEEMALEFKKFVAISLVEPNQVHAPPGPVDMFWHFLLLHTVQYNEFCDKVWGTHVFDKDI